MNDKKLLTRVRTYATSANLGPGFDCAGIALNIYNECAVYSNGSKNNRISLQGKNVQGIAEDDSNLIFKTIRKVLERKYGASYERYEKPVEIICKINVPVERGLGSSSTAVVAGLLVANEIYDLNLSNTELLNIGLDIEPHPDNIAPCIAGGLVISYKTKSGNYSFEKIKIKKNFKVLLMIPGFKVNTCEARKLIPELIPKKDAISNIANFAILINCLKEGNIENAFNFIQDQMHQPFRKDIYVDSFNLVEELNDCYEIPAAISGSGPTVLAFIPNNKLTVFMSSHLDKLKNKYQNFQFKLTTVRNEGSYCF